MDSDEELRPDSVEEEEEGGGPVKPFLDHLEDLRWVLIKSGAALLVGMSVCMASAPQLMAILTAPLTQAQSALPKSEKVDLDFLGPIGAAASVMKIGLWGGILLALPFIIYFVGDFVVPALKKREKKYLRMAFGIGTGLFLSGVVLCYFVVLSLSLKGMMLIAKWMGVPPGLWRAEEYLTFVIALMLGMGISFELPVILLTLVRLGILPHEWMVKGRRYFFFGNVIVCAFITPDALSTVFLVLPTQVLLEICIWISRGWEKQRQLEEARFAAEDSKQLPSSTD